MLRSCDLSVLSASALIVRLRQQRRYSVHLFTALDSDCLTPHVDIRPIRITRVFHIFRSKRLCNDVFHVRVDESLKLVESVPARTGHTTHYRSPSPSPLHTSSHSRSAGENGPSKLPITGMSRSFGSERLCP